MTAQQSNEKFRILTTWIPAGGSRAISRHLTAPRKTSQLLSLLETLPLDHCEATEHHRNQWTSLPVAAKTVA